MLADIKAGDKVLLTLRHGHKSVETVERVTKTQIILQDGTRYTRTWGERIGQSAVQWHGKDIIRVADEADLRRHWREHAVEEARTYGKRLSRTTNEDEVLQIIEWLTWERDNIEKARQEENAS